MESREIMKFGNFEVAQGIVNFNEYEILKSEAQRVAQIILETEVTEENIKESKKLLAKVNNSVKEIEARRISVKKYLLEPYEEFEAKVKEIVGIVKEADEVVRVQVREIEEIERERKRVAITEIWNLRIVNYDFKGLFTLDSFLKPKHLNKTETLKKVEEEMVDWLEARRKDIEAIRLMENGTEIMEVYIATLDLGLSVSSTMSRIEQRKQIESVVKTDKPNKTYYFILHDEKDAAMAELLLSTNKISYEKEIR